MKDVILVEQELQILNTPNSVNNFSFMLVNSVIFLIPAEIRQLTFHIFKIEHKKNLLESDC